MSNVACGFDVLGFAIEGLGDEVLAERSERPGVELARIRGDHGALPTDPERNTASVAVRALAELVGAEEGIRLFLDKRMPLSSGLGSSAASAVAAVVAADRLLESRLPLDELLRCAIIGEQVASGSVHADNVAPALYGGLVLVRGVAEGAPEVVRLPVPTGLSCALIRPEIEVETRQARLLLGDTVALPNAVTQWSNLASLVVALFRSDLDLLSRSLRDVIAEPVRAALVPGFAEVQGAAVEAGALGCSLSGSGPSIFALCADRDAATEVSRVMADTLERVTGVACDRLVSAVDSPGASHDRPRADPCAS